MISGFVKFGDGSRYQALGKGTVIIPGLSVLKDMPYVDRLKANPSFFFFNVQFFKILLFYKELYFFSTFKK